MRCADWYTHGERPAHVHFREEINPKVRAEASKGSIKRPFDGEMSLYSVVLLDR